MSCRKCFRDGICDSRKCAKPTLACGVLRYRCGGECTCKGRMGGTERFHGRSAARGPALPKRNFRRMVDVNSVASGSIGQGAAGDSAPGAVVHAAVLGAVDEDAAQQAEAADAISLSVPEAAVHKAARFATEEDATQQVEAGDVVSRASELSEAVLRPMQVDVQAYLLNVDRRTGAERASEII
jgi:Arc/MetJ family transcription regulator